jgi:D-lactate dehydrogenase
VVKILAGFGCKILAYDVYRNADAEAAGARYVPLTELLKDSDIITLHCPLTPQTHHMINAESLAQMKAGVTLINTSRGALIDTPAVINALKGGRVGLLGLDVYEEEEGVFFEDLSHRVLADDVLARLLTFPNVLITGHQAFLTEEALTNIADTTLQNITQVRRGEPCPNRVEVSPK